MLKTRIFLRREVHRRGWTIHKIPTFLKPFHPDISVVLGRRIKVKETLFSFPHSNSATYQALINGDISKFIG